MYCWMSLTAEDAGWEVGRQVVTIATPRAAVCHNTYQENEPVCPDDKSAVRQEVGVVKRRIQS